MRIKFTVNLFSLRALFHSPVSYTCDLLLLIDGNQGVVFVMVLAMLAFFQMPVSWCFRPLWPEGWRKMQAEVGAGQLLTPGDLITGSWSVCSMVQDPSLSHCFSFLRIVYSNIIHFIKLLLKPERLILLIGNPPGLPILSIVYKMSTR